MIMNIVSKKINRLIKMLKWISIASLIGIVGGLSSIILSIIIEHFPEKNNILLIPIVFFICGLFVDYIYELKGSGIDRVLKALNNNIPLTWIKGLLKVLLAGIVIAVGGSAGKEGPCVQSSASFADELYRLLKLRNRELVIITGIAGGLSGAFAAPLGTAILACEIIEHENFSYINILPPIIASVVGYIIYYLSTGKRHLFNVYFIYTLHPMDFIWFIIGAFFCSFIAYLYIKTYRKISSTFDTIKLPYCIKTLIGGIIVAVIGYFIPEIFGLGLDLIKDLFFIKYSLILLVLILIGKIFATSFTVGSGVPGGLIFPSMCIGAISGAIFGSIIGANPVPYIVLGIATSLSASTNAPLGGAVLCTEIFGFDFAVPSSIGAVIGYQTTKFDTIFKYIRF
ncbi:Chloride channel voltage-gated family protein [Methanocaldococcus lauensis]|uniref:Chloride channel voltage-gated family protein n=1 Tax=Methanocaldococcus lauensis TaxID=2546128 RepID=A0A8D6Q0I6_9EURY|nr:chloride channel protein [Methanocaldococcus lauensis]CAB3289113.1 Chloride channel voltage-gated family protein [Methanocaldococcus lauensis]CAB3289873.1 Chloride channel voltage-gated family protein [Methanocaldococcus lauensis]